MSKHTPWPWRSSFKTANTNNLGIYTSNGSLLATISVHQLAPPPLVQRYEADARLMAAAPELLEALRSLLDEADEGWPAPATRAKAAAAIAKAEGA